MVFVFVFVWAQRACVGRARARFWVAPPVSLWRSPPGAARTAPHTQPRAASTTAPRSAAQRSTPLLARTPSPPPLHAPHLLHVLLDPVEHAVAAVAPHVALLGDERAGLPVTVHSALVVGGCFVKVWRSEGGQWVLRRELAAARARARLPCRPLLARALSPAGQTAWLLRLRVAAAKPRMYEWMDFKKCAAHEQRRAR